MTSHFPTLSPTDVRQALLDRREIALLDVREEEAHAQAHPLFAANLPASRVEIDAFAKLPRRDVPIVVLDDGEGEAEVAAQRLTALGYSAVHLLQGGLDGWRRSGGELFSDVNVPSKAFGEYVETNLHTPSLSAQEVKDLIDHDADIVIVDVRRFDEYQTMSIPTGISVPGAEVALRVPQLVSGPETVVIVNCAGRTRSIIGTQSLINAGLNNRVVALRNGTIGWTLAGLNLDHGAQRRFPDVAEPDRRRAALGARAMAERAGVGRVRKMKADEWATQEGRTTYFFDVRTPEEYEQAHLPNYRLAPGGQLVQETEMFAPVRGARIVLADDDGVRANMTASWLAQMDWDVYVLDDLHKTDFAEHGEWRRPLPPIPHGVSERQVLPHALREWLASDDTAVIDLAPSSAYAAAHVPGSWFALRSRLAEAVRAIPRVKRYVLTSGHGHLAPFVVPELTALVSGEVYNLDGGTHAWKEAGFALESGTVRLASPPLDRYRRPYEDPAAPARGMQAYIDWELGLVEQLKRDGTHHFRVVQRIPNELE